MEGMVLHKTVKLVLKKNISPREVICNAEGVYVILFPVIVLNNGNVTKSYRPYPSRKSLASQYCLIWFPCAQVIIYSSSW